MDAVSAGYPGRDVLRGCSLGLAGGEVVAVIGPNGAGKTTLLRVLAGIVAPRSGDVRVDGHPLSPMSRAEIARQVAVVPQSLEVLFPFTVREIVSLGRTARLDALGRATSQDRDAVAGALATLDLTSLAERRIDHLSGGERQRAVLAMALAQDTPVLLLDEPTVHLDPGHQLATFSLVTRLAHERQLAVLAIVHDLNLSALADRVVVLTSGAIIADGPPGTVLRAELVERVFGPGWRVIARDGAPAIVPELSR